MADQDPLALQIVRLNSREVWKKKGSELFFIFPKEGAGKYVSGPNNQALARGDVLLVSAAFEGTLCAEDGELAFWWFSLRMDHLFPLFGNNEISLLQQVIENFSGAKVYHAASPLAKECHNLLGSVPSMFNLIHRGQLLRVATAILSAEFDRAGEQRAGRFARGEDHIVAIFEKLSVAELLELSVDELAGKFNCSRRHLSRLFHQHFGFSVAALKMEMRLLKAVSLLREPEAKIINVAEQCGFNHLGLFNTCFKRRFGASPGSWRKMSLPVESHPAGVLGKVPACPQQANGLCPWSGKSDTCNSAVRKVLQF